MFDPLRCIHEAAISMDACMTLGYICQQFWYDAIITSTLVTGTCVLNTKYYDSALHRPKEIGHIKSISRLVTRTFCHLRDIRISNNAKSLLMKNIHGGAFRPSSQHSALTYWIHCWHMSGYHTYNSETVLHILSVSVLTSRLHYSPCTADVKLPSNIDQAIRRNRLVNETIWPA